MMLRRVGPLAALFIVLGACSSAGGTPVSRAPAAQSQLPTAAATPTVAETSTLAPTPTATPAGLASADLTVTGGKYAGHYTMTALDGPGCTTGALGGGSLFQVSSFQTIEPSGGPFTQFSLTIHDVLGAATGTDQFDSNFVFGNNAYVIEVSGAIGGTQATATLQLETTTATATVKGTSPTGETVDATFQCYKISP